MSTYENAEPMIGWKCEPRPNPFAEPPPAEWPIPENVILSEN